LPANELLALDNIPCAPQSQLFDRSKLGVIVYQRLRYAETTGDVSLLEEAGRILREQMANAWTPATSANGDQSSMANAWTPVTSVSGDQSSIPDLPDELRSNIPPRQENASAQAGTHNIYGSRDMPFRPNTTSSPNLNECSSTALAPGVKARIIRGDVYYMPITLTFNSGVSNSSIAINVPGRATATYPEPLTTGARSGDGGRLSAPVVKRDSTGNARSNGSLLGTGS